MSVEEHVYRIATVKPGGGGVVELWTDTEHIATLECHTQTNANDLAAFINKCVCEVWGAKGRESSALAALRDIERKGP